MIMKHFKEFVIVHCLFIVNVILISRKKTTNPVIVFLKICGKSLVQQGAVGCFVQCNSIVIQNIAPYATPYYTLPAPLRFLLASVQENASHH